MGLVATSCAGPAVSPAPPADPAPSSAPASPSSAPWLPLIVDSAPPLSSPAPGDGEAPHETSRYTLLPDVVLSPDIERVVARLASAYFRRTGHDLVVTSGTRDATHQAAAFYELLELGVDVKHRYRQGDAARELVREYHRARAARKAEPDVIAELARVLVRQMDRGVYLSAHLRAGAIDVRSRGMSGSDKHAFREVVEELGNIYLLEEPSPPHFHLEVDPPE